MSSLLLIIKRNKEYMSAIESDASSEICIELDSLNDSFEDLNLHASGHLSPSIEHFSCPLLLLQSHEDENKINSQSSSQTYPYAPQSR